MTSRDDMVKYNQNYDTLLQKAGVLKHAVNGKMPQWLFERLNRLYAHILVPSCLAWSWDSIHANRTLCALASLILKGKERTKRGKALLVEFAMMTEADNGRRRPT